MDLITLKAYLYKFKNILKNKETLYFTGIYRKNITLGNNSAQWTISIEDIKPGSIIYCFGVGQEISFDLALIKKFGVIINAFDPSPGAIDWIKNQVIPERFHFFPFGLGGKNGTVEFGFTGSTSASSATILKDVSDVKDRFVAEIKTLKTIMEELGHSRIDVLKMDIEGAEYEVIENILNEGIEIQQLLVEFHHRFRNIGIKPTRNAVKSLKKAGFKIFHVSPNGEELSFYNVRMAEKR
jgi:FkbM family methyltransferase